MGVSDWMGKAKTSQTTFPLINTTTSDLESMTWNPAQGLQIVLLQNTLVIMPSETWRDTESGRGTGTLGMCGTI